MCNSQNRDYCCCPSPQIIQEKICGNFRLQEGTSFEVWNAVTDTGVIQGTFEIFSSSINEGVLPITGTINPGAIVITASPGNSVTSTILNPTSFNIEGEQNDSGTYCITLYKRIP
ncbi:S-Ena type endospore appendage, partial [Xenorhabdus szentirmaii]